MKFTQNPHAITQTRKSNIPAEILRIDEPLLSLEEIAMLHEAVADEPEADFTFTPERMLAIENKIEALTDGFNYLFTQMDSLKHLLKK